MISLVLAVLLLAPGAPSAADEVGDCTALLPTTKHAELPVSGLPEARRMWSKEQDVSTDTLHVYIRQIRKTRRCLLDLDPSSTSTPHFGLIILSYRWESYFHTALRQFDTAFQVFEEALSLLEDPPYDRDALDVEWGEEKTNVYQARGYLHYILGDLPASVQDYLRAYEATPASRTGDRSEQLINVGLLHQRTQDYQTARHYYRRADQLLETSSPSTVADYAQRRARTFSIRAELLVEETLNTEYDRTALRRARDLAREGRAAAERGSNQYAEVSLVLSETLGYLGAFEEAYRLNEEVRRLYGQPDETTRIHAYALYKLGVLHLQTERWARADSVLHEALDDVRTLGDFDRRRRVLRDLGRLYELQGDWERAEHYYRQGIEGIEEYRTSLTASQWSATAFGQWQAPYRGLVRVLLAQHRPEEALATLDRTRARHLQDLRTQRRLSDQLSAQRRARFDSLTRALTEVRGRLSRAGSLSGQAETELRNREASLMAARRQTLQFDSASTRPSLDAVADSLDAQDRVLVSYFLDDPWPIYDRSPRSAAFVVARDSLRTVSLPGLTQDSVQSEMQEISPLFADQGPPDPSHPNALHFDLQPLQVLHDALYAPVARHLPSERPLTVVPDGPLFRLPFSMLVESMPGGRFDAAEAQYLVHERPTSTALATSLVTAPADEPPSAGARTPTVAAYGVSTFDSTQTQSSAFRAALPWAAEDSVSQIPSLPGVRTELRALQNTVADVRVALGEDATKPRLRRDLSQAGVLHVASHAFVNSTSPFQNALLLHPDSSSRTEDADGVLFLHELRGHADLPLVVLSACNTARGPTRDGEGMQGLQYAFRAMGTHSTLSTLWPVADDASAELMTGFYRHLRDGVSKDQALRRARIDYLEAHPQRASPFFWAAPVLSGSSAPVPLQSASVVASRSAWLWGGLAVLGGLVLASGLLWQSRGRLPEPFCTVGRPT